MPAPWKHQSQHLLSTCRRAQPLTVPPSVHRVSPPPCTAGQGPRQARHPPRPLAPLCRPQHQPSPGADLAPTASLCWEFAGYAAWTLSSQSGSPPRDQTQVCSKNTERAGAPIPRVSEQGLGPKGSPPWAPPGRAALAPGPAVTLEGGPVEWRGPSFLVLTPGVLWHLRHYRRLPAPEGMALARAHPRDQAFPRATFLGQSCRAPPSTEEMGGFLCSSRGSSSCGFEEWGQDPGLVEWVAPCPLPLLQAGCPGSAEAQRGQSRAVRVPARRGRQQQSRSPTKETIFSESEGPTGLVPSWLLPGARGSTLRNSVGLL